MGARRGAVRGDDLDQGFVLAEVGVRFGCDARSQGRDLRIVDAGLMHLANADLSAQKSGGDSATTTSAGGARVVVATADEANVA